MLNSLIARLISRSSVISVTDRVIQIRRTSIPATAGWDMTLAAMTATIVLIDPLNTDASEVGLVLRIDGIWLAVVRADSGSTDGIGALRRQTLHSAMVGTGMVTTSSSTKILITMGGTWHTTCVSEPMFM